MVGIVLVSHSKSIVNGISELASQMVPNAKLALAGGTDDGRLGTDANKIMNAIESVYSDDGVIILFDLGSAYMNAQMAIEFLDDNMQENIEIVDASLVEGAITAIVESSLEKSKEEIKKSLKNMEIGKMP